MSLRLSSAVGLLWAALALAAPADLRSAFTNPTNRWAANTTISFPGSANFDNATVRWNGYEGPDYSVAITPGTADDAAKAVRIARSQNVPLLATGGRHSSSTTLNDVEHGVAIDLGRLNSVAVDAKAGTLTVGGGTRFGQVVEPVYQAGYEMPLGSCACPGAVGASIGGGVGRFQGVFGLLIDQLLSVRIITANGELITASKTEHPDLFWAVRGAGANFGIITSATYNLPRPINNGLVLNADFTFAASKNASYFDLIQKLKGTIPAELSTITITYWNADAGEAQLLVNWVYIGPEDEGRKWIAPLEALGPLTSSVSVIPYNKIYPTALGGLGNTICGNDVTSEVGYGINFANLSSSTYQTIFKKLSNFYITYPDGRASGIEMEVFAPQAVQKVPVRATAYPWRDTLGYSLISFKWNSTATQVAGAALAEEIRADYTATSGYPGLRVYVSYGHGNESPEQIWGVNLPRLERLKGKWDPDNVFRFYHAITPKSH